MALEHVRIIASKYRAEVATTSSIFLLATGTAASLTITIPKGYILYLFETKGYVTTSDVMVDMRDKHNTALWSWSEYPNTLTTFENLPFMHYSFRDKISFLFTNTSGSTTTICWAINGILVPEPDKDKFEAEVKSLVEVSPSIREIKESISKYELELKKIYLPNVE